MTKTKSRSTEVVIVKMPWWNPLLAWVMLAVAVAVAYLGYIGELGLWKNTLGLVSGVLGVLLILPIAVGMTVFGGRVLVGSPGKLVAHRFWPVPWRSRLVGDLSDVEILSPEMSLLTVDRRGIQPLDKEKIVPQYDHRKLVVGGLAGSVNVWFALELVNDDFVERFREWQAIQLPSSAADGLGEWRRASDIPPDW